MWEDVRGKLVVYITGAAVSSNPGAELIDTVDATVSLIIRIATAAGVIVTSAHAIYKLWRDLKKAEPNGRNEPDRVA